MKNFDDNATGIVPLYFDYEKKLSPLPSIWIQLAFLPLAIALTIVFCHWIFKTPHFPFEKPVVDLLGIATQACILGWLIQDVFFKRIKTKVETMCNDLVLEQEIGIKLKTYSVEALKTFLDFLNFHLNVKEKSAEMYVAIAVSAGGLFLSIHGQVDKPYQIFFIILNIVAIVTSISFIRSRKSIVQLRRFEDLLRNVLASYGGPE